jgi:TonB family protein
MNRMTRTLAALFAAGIALSALPAMAQYQNEYYPAKVAQEGKASHDIAGSGEVTVQVQVNADGSHKVIKVLKSTNAADNAAAMDIAQSSTYTPAKRGTTPITSFYDFVLKFNGKSVAANPDADLESGNTAAIYDLVHAGKYKDAIAKANDALASTPGDPAVLQLLGVAQFYDNDFADAATSFAKAGTIRKSFEPIAAQAYAIGAVKTSQTDPSQSLDFAHRAVELANNANSKFALGVALIGNKQYSDALVPLKSVHDGTADAKIKMNVDQQLLIAYLATGDTASADATAAEMKSIDPSGGTLAAHAIATHYLQAANDALNAKNYDVALKNYDLADNAGSAADAVTAENGAALTLLTMPKPDYAKAKDYAVKAVTAAPDNAQANFFAGVAYGSIYASSHSKGDRQQALDYLNKADSLAKAAGNTAFATQIESQIKNVPQ